MSTPRHPDALVLDDARIGRNWSELLEEFRVAQTGGQILTAFLLTVPSAPGFDELDAPRRWVFGVVL